MGTETSADEASDHAATQWQVVALDHSGKRRTFAARRVIFAAPSFLATWLLEGFGTSPLAEDSDESHQLRNASSSSIARGDSEVRPTDRAAALRQFRYAVWVVANLQLNRTPDETSHPIAWDNVIHGSRSLGYLATSYQRGFDRGPAVWTWYYPLTDGEASERRRRLEAAGRDEWAEIVLSDLERPHPDIRDRVQRIDVMRWGHAMIQPIPGFRFSTARQAAGQPWRGVHFAHSDTSGLPLFEEAFQRGLETARRVVSELSRDAGRSNPPTLPPVSVEVEEAG